MVCPKQELPYKEQSAANNWKVINQDIQFESNVNGVVEETAAHGNADTMLLHSL